MPHSPSFNRDRARQDLAWVDRVTWLMDNKFSIGWGRFRFGLDPILNFIPFLGNLVGASISLMLVIIMWRNGVSRKVVLLMLINVLIDLGIGSIPILGKVGDFFFKANARNIKLLKAHYMKDKYHGKGNDVIAAVIGVVLLIIIGLIVLIWQGVAWLISLF